MHTAFRVYCTLASLAFSLTSDQQTLQHIFEVQFNASFSGSNFLQMNLILKKKNEWNTQLSDRCWETTAAPEKTTTAAWEQAENFIVMATHDKQSTILNNRDKNMKNNITLGSFNYCALVQLKSCVRSMMDSELHNEKINQRINTWLK